MLLRRLNKLTLRCSQLPAKACNSTAAAAAAETNSNEYARPLVPATDYRTTEQNTASHNQLHEAKFYSITAEQKKQIFGGGGLPRKYELQLKTFAENCLMVRKPALEVIDFIKNTDFNKPCVRYVLIGDNGVGKTLSLAHILHFGAQNNFLLVHVPWAANWMKRPKETANFADGFIDLLFDAAAWLLHFKTQNAKLLSTLNLNTSKDYVWSKRETTPAGSTLLELVEHGIARIKFASETVAALLSEIKQHATGNRCKVMVAIDGFNAFFHPVTRILADNKQRVTPDRITLTKPFLDITSYNWTNAVCVLTVDKIAMTEGFMESCLPQYLLGKAGFEHLDPFVPIFVQNYSDKEFESVINYYLDRHWITKAQDGFDAQLKYMSNKNPYQLMELTKSI